MTAEPRVCAVLGSPIAHSLSPALHRAAYAELGLDWRYERHEVDAAGLPGFVAGLGPQWRGLSCTMPLKEAVLALGEPEPTAVQAGAGNTLLLDAEGGPQVYNTDVPGLAWALRRAGADALGRVTLLGAGATGRSSLLSVARLGVRRVGVVVRTPAKAAPLVTLGEQLGVAVDVLAWGAPLPSADALLSTVVAGAADPLAEEAAASAPLVFDAIYHPWPTPLAVVAERAGRVVVNGLDLLVGQALRQVELMTGAAVPAEVLYAAARQPRHPGTPERPAAP